MFLNFKIYEISHDKKLLYKNQHLLLKQLRID